MTLGESLGRPQVTLPVASLGLCSTQSSAGYCGVRKLQGPVRTLGTNNFRTTVWCSTIRHVLTVAELAWRFNFFWDPHKIFHFKSRETLLWSCYLSLFSILEYTVKWLVVGAKKPNGILAFISNSVASGPGHGLSPCAWGWWGCTTNPVHSFGPLTTTSTMEVLLYKIKVILWLYRDKQK